MNREKEGEKQTKMTKKYLQMCSTSLVIREMQIELL